MSSQTNIDLTRSTFKMKLNKPGFHLMMQSIANVSFRLLTYISFGEMTLLGLYHAKNLDIAVILNDLRHIANRDYGGDILHLVSVSTETKDLANSLLSELEPLSSTPIRRQDLIITVCRSLSIASDYQLKTALESLRENYTSPSKLLSKEIDVTKWNP